MRIFSKLQTFNIHYVGLARTLPTWFRSALFANTKFLGYLKKNRKKIRNLVTHKSERKYVLTYILEVDVHSVT